MAALSVRSLLLPLTLLALVQTGVRAQTVTPASARVAIAASSDRAAPAWTLKLKQDIRWQQVTPAGALLVSTDAALTGIDMERGQVIWEKPELGGLPEDSVRMVEGSLLMEAARPGLLLIFDPVTGSVLFDSRQLGLAEVVTRRVLPQSGTILIHGRRPSGPPVVALYDLATGDQRWTNESLFEQTEPKKRGLGGLVQGLVRKVSEGTALEVLQAGPDMIVVHTLMGLRALDARTGKTRWSAALPTAKPGNPARHVRLYPSVDRERPDLRQLRRSADGLPTGRWAAALEQAGHGERMDPRHRAASRGDRDASRGGAGGRADREPHRDQRRGADRPERRRATRMGPRSPPSRSRCGATSPMR